MADLKKIYNALREKGVVTKSYEEFANAMADGNKRKNVYNALAQQGLITKSYKQFSDAVAPSHAPQTTQSTSTAPRNNDWVKQGLSVLKGVPSMPTPNIPSYRPTPLKPSEQNFDEIIANGSVYKDDNTYNSVVSGLDERIKQAQQQYDALLKQHSQNVKKGRKEASFWERLGAMPDVDDVPTKTSDDVLTPESDQLRAARETLHRLQNTRVQLERGRESKTQGEELDKRKKNGSGLLERAAYKTAISLENFGKGFMDALRGSDMWATNDAANDLMAVKNIVHKVDKWNALTDKEKSAMTSDDLLKIKPTDDELEILNNYALAYNVNAQAQDPISSNWSYMAGGVSASSALFGIEMAASGGMNVSSSAGRAIEKGALRLSQKAVKNGLEKLVGKTFEKSLARKIAGGVGQLPVQFGMGALESTVLQNGLTERKAQEYEIGTPLMSMDENGVLKYSGSLGKLDAKSAHNRALVEQTIENQTEMLGGQIGEVLGGLTKVGVKVLNKTKLGENITKLMTDVSSNQFNRIMNNALNTAGYNGFLGEYLEEHAGDVEQALFLGTMTFDTDPETGIYNKEHILETMSGLAPMMGGHMVMEGTSYGASRARMAMMLSMAERKGSKLFGDERWAQVKQSLGGLDNQQFADKLSSMLQDKTLSDKQKKAVYNYAFYEKARQGFELMSLKQDMEGAVSLIDKNSRTNFVIGYEKGGQAAGELLTNLQKAQRNLRVRLGDYGYRQLFEENGNDFNKAYNSGVLDTDQKKQAYLDYVNALSCYQGALQRLHNDKKSELVNAKTDVDNIMDEQGNIVSATTTDGKKVNIVNGNVVLNEDGSVNVEKSGSLVVVDSDGKRKMISASEVASVDSVTKASDVLAQKNKEIVDKYATEEMSQKIQVGAQLPILTPNGSGIATIVSVNEDGSVSFKMGDSENIITTDAYNLYVMNLNAEVSSALREDDDAEQSTESASETATEGGQPLSEEASPKEESREYAQGDVFDVVVDGQKMHAEIVSPKDADGRFVVNVDDGESMRTLYVTPEELATMEYKEPKEETLTESENPRTIDTEEPPISNATPTEHTPTALERVPTDEKGNRRFHDVDAETGWDALVEMSQGDAETAQVVADASRENAEKELKSAQKSKPKGDTPEEILKSVNDNKAAVAEAQRKVDAWKAIAGERKRRAEEAERVAEEKAEAERKAQEERERAEKEEKARVEAEKAEEEARVEAERKEEKERKTEEKERKAKTDGDGQNGFNFFTGTINELIAATRKKGSSLIKKVLSAASNRLIADLKDKGVDISPEYNHTIDNNAINHALNRHSSDKEKEQGQIPLTEKDIENVNDVIDNYDEIKTEKNSRGQDIIIYKKRYTDGTTLYVEEVRTGRKELAMASMRKQRSRKLTDADDLKSTPSSDLPSASIDKGSKKAEKKQEKQSVFDKAKEIADKEEKKRKAEADKPKQKPLTEAERKDAEEVAGALGYRVEWVDTMEENGTIDADRKVIRIAKDAENPLVQVLGHEVAHGVKRMDGGKFKALQKAAMEVVGEKEWNERIEKKRKLNAYAEGKLAEEVTCDIVGEALNNKDALKRLAESLRGEKGIIARLRDAVARMVEYFKNRGDKEGVRRMKAADKLLAEFESALKEGEGVNESAREAGVPTDNVGNIDFSHRTYHDYKDDDGNEHRGTRGKIIEYLNNAGMKKSDIGKFVDNMDYWYDLTGKVASLVDKDGNFDFPAFHEWSQTSPLYKKYEGNIVRAVSTLVSNGEYPLNFELSTDCIKREAFTQILNEMVDLGGAIWKNLTPAKIQELRTLQQSYGIQVACPLCFVEGKRLNIMKWATGVTDKWNEAVRRVVGDEATPFGFGKGTYVPATPYNERTTPQEVTDQINEVARIVGSREGALPKDLARMQENTKAMEALLQQYYEDYVAKHGSAEGFSLSEAQLGELAKLRGKGASNVVDRMVDMIATHPELQHTLDVSDLVGSKGLMAIRGQSGDGFAKMYSLIVCANGTGTPKIVQDAQPYSGEILDVRQSKFDKAAEIGGARLFSFSDFDLTKTFDIMQIMWDCAARKAKVQSYSKEIPYILMFGKSGVKINMSMLPEARPSEGLVQEYKEAKGSARKYVLEKIRENAGLDMEGGHIVGIQLSDSHSVSKEFAESIYHNPDYNANCGAIMVGISVNHALYAMGQDYIRQVIPFHLSGMPISARRATDCQYYRDFTSEQNTGIIVNGRRVKQFDGGGKPIHNKDVPSDFDFYEGENEKGWDMRQRCRDYVKWCGENGLVPRFEWAVNSDNYKAWCKKKGYQPNQEIVDMMDAHTTDGVYDEYYKVITDFTAYKPIFDKDGNTIGEEPAPHRPVTGDFAMDDKTLGMVLGVDSEGGKVDDNSMLANRENTIKNADANKKEIAEKALLILNGKAKVEDLVRKGGEQFDNNSDSDKFFESSNEGIDRSVRESRSEKTELTEEERELRDNLVERMRKGGLDVVTDSEEMQRVIDTENERTRNKRSKKSEAARKRDEALYAVDWSTAFVSGKSREEATEIRRERGRKFKEETKELYGRVLSGNFDDVTLRLIDKFVDKSTPNNPYERPISKRLPARALQKMRGGERTGSIDALFSRISESAVGKDGKALPRAERERAIEEKKKELLKKWAIATGNWHTDIADFTDQREPIGSGTDSDVYLGKDGKSVIKVSKGKPYGKRFRPDVDNVALFNTVFPGSRYTIEGYGEVDGKFVRFLKQPIVDFTSSTPLTEGERVAYMEKLGFKPINKENTAFSNGEIIASDLQKSNIVKDKQGNVRVIDADMKLHTKDVGGNYSYPDVETDTTGLAEREEVNTGSVREHRVYHGSGADFDAFDHSHMGEGEGAQAYGWGTYVTEVEGIGRTYAIQNTTTHNDALRALQHDVDAISDQLNRHRDDLKYDEEQLKRANEWRAEAELDYELFKDEAEKLKEKYGESSPEYRNHLFNDIYTDEMKRAQSSVKSTEESIQYRKEKIAELEKALKDKQAEIDELPKEFPRHLYTVEIPDDNGSNYLDWNGHPAESLLKDVGSFLEGNGFERVQDSPARYEKGESTVVLNPKATGADLYAELREALGSDKKASQALAELGCIGIKYPADNMRGGRKDGAKNYVIFNEKDAKITDHTRFLRTASGEVYGLVKDGRIYLDPKVATAETAVHEYTHLWGDMLRRKDSEQWSHTVKELKNSVLWEEVKELYPELKTDDEIADEVLSTFSGRRGAERLREEARRVADGEGGVFTKAKAIETLERVKEAIARFWEGVARMFGINRYRSAEELADMAMKDLLDSKNPMKDESGMRKRGEVGDEGVKSLKGEEAMVALDNIFEDKKTENMPQKVSSLVKFMELFRKPVRTFLGEVVRVKEEVYNKIIREKRTSISGAVLPTLENADFAIRDTDGSTLYIKRFKSENNDNVYNIAVVNKYGEVEDYVSSVHIKSDNNLRNKITKGAELLLPQERITDGILPRNNSTPGAKVANYSETAKPRYSRKPGESIFDYASRVSEDGLLFRDGGTEYDFPGEDDAQKLYNAAVDGRKSRAIESWQDEMFPVKMLQEAIEKATGEKIADFENAYLLENQLGSAGNATLEKYAREVQNPMRRVYLDMLKAKFDGGSKVTKSDINKYVIAVHGLERNKYMADKNKGLPDARRDYSGFTALFGNGEQVEVEELERRAEEYIGKFEDAVGKDKADKLWSLVDESRQRTLDELVKSGLVSGDVADEWLRRFEHYVPLQGFSEEVIGEDRNANFENHITGRMSEARDPLATLVNMEYVAVTSGNHNRVKQALYNLALNHRTNLLSVMPMFSVKNPITGEWEDAVPQIDETMSPIERQQKVDKFIKQMSVRMREEKDLPESDKTVKDARKVSVGSKVLPKAMPDFIVRMKVNGRQYAVVLNGNPRAAQAINGRLKEHPNKALQKISGVTRFMSAAVTAWNAAFMLSNFARDVQAANAFAYSNEGAKYAAMMDAEIHKNMSLTSLGRDLFGMKNKGIYKLYYKYRHNQLDMSNERERFFKEFVDNGGETGYTQMVDIDKIAKQMQKDEFSAIKAIKSVGKFIELANKGFENATRFAAYATSRKMGKSVMQSINDAKEISVNFNRHGNGRNGYVIAKSLYQFLNPTIQGLEKQLRTIKEHPLNGTAVLIATPIAIGFAIPLVNIGLAMLSGEGDDDKKYYWSLSDWTRRNNLIIGVNGKFIKIPLPPELRVFYGIGEMLASKMSNPYDKTNLLTEIPKHISETLPFNDTNSTFPSFVKPFIESEITDKDFMGRKITGRSDYNTQDPEWKRAGYNTDDEYIAVAKWWHSLFTDNDNERGSWFAEINPSVAEHLIKGYTGGIGSIVGQVYTTVKAIAKGNEKDYSDSRNWPIVNRVYVQNTKEDAVKKTTNTAYRFYQDNYKNYEHTFKETLKDEKSGIFQKAQRISNMVETSEYKRYRMTESFIKADKLLWDEIKALKETDDKESLEWIEKEQTRLRSVLVEASEKFDIYDNAGLTYKLDRMSKPGAYKSDLKIDVKSAPNKDMRKFAKEYNVKIGKYKQQTYKYEQEIKKHIRVNK